MKKILFVAAVAGLTTSAHAQLAGSAQMTMTPSGGGFNNSMVVHNTGSTTVGTFWFAWIRSYDFLPTLPTNITSPAGWTAFVTGGPLPFDGYAIEWQASDAAHYIAPGGTLAGFNYSGTESAAVLSGPAFNNSAVHTVTSFLYIGPAQGDLGYQFDVQIVPAPAGLTGMLLGAAALMRRRR